MASAFDLPWALSNPSLTDALAIIMNAIELRVSAGGADADSDRFEIQRTNIRYWHDLLVSFGGTLIPIPTTSRLGRMCRRRFLLPPT